MKSLFYNLNEFGCSIGVSKPTMRTYLKEDRYSHFKKGTRYFIPRSSVEMSNAIKKVREDESLETPLILNVTNQKGGVGKTTTCLNLATAYSFYGLNVLLIDNDIQGNASSINDEDGKAENDFLHNNLTNLLLSMDELDVDELDEIIEKTTVLVKNEKTRFKGKLDLMPNNFTAGEKIEMFITRAGSENLLDRLLKRIKHKYDVIVIDNSPSLNTMWRMSVMASNATLITLRPDKYSVDGIVGVLKAIKKNNNAYFDRHQRDINIVGIMVSVFDAQTNSDKFGINYIKEILEEKKITFFEPYISRTTLVNDSQFLGGSALYEDTISKTSGEYLELAYKIYEEFYNKKSSYEQ